MQKCTNYTQYVFPGEEKVAPIFSIFMAQVEERFKCSGICAKQQPKLSFYLFSNVNNGWPRRTCKKPIYKTLRTMANFYFLRVASIAAFAIIVLIFFSVMLLYRIKQVCCCNKGETVKGPKKRANNGMVIGEDGLRDIEMEVN